MQSNNPITRLSALAAALAAFVLTSAPAHGAPWTPSDLGSGVALWLDASDASTITKDGSDLVSQWNDKSGNGRNATQGTAAQQPTYQATGLNSMPALSFDGGNPGDNLLLPTGFLYNQAAFTVAFVMSAPSGQGNDGIFGPSNDGNKGLELIFFGNNTFGVNGSRLSATANTWWSTDNNPALTVLDGSAAGRNVYKNGTSALANTTPISGLNFNGVYSLGAYYSPSYAAQMKMAEFVVCSSALSLADRQKLEGYLAWKWETQASLPENHPYKDAAPTSNIYWDGTGTAWDAVGSWSTAIGATTPDPSAVPGPSDAPVFNITTENTPQTVNLNAAQTVSGLAFNSTGTVAFQGGSGNQTLSLGSVGIVLDSVDGAVTIGSASAGQNVAVSLQAAQTWTSGGSGVLTIQNGVSIGAGGNQTLTLAGANTGANTLAGAVENGAATLSLTKIDAGTWVLSGSNTYTGSTTLTAGVLSVGASGNLGAASSNLVFNGGTLRITGTGLTSLSGLGRTVVFNSGKTVGLDIDDAANTFTADQVLNQGAGGLTKAGAGTLVLSQTNTYTGATSVNAGTLRVDGSLSSGGAAVSVPSGGTLGIGASGNVARDVNVSGGMVNQAGTVTGTLTVSGGTVDLAGTVAGRLRVTGGTVATSAGSPTVTTADFSAPGAATVTATTPLAVTSTLWLPSGAKATLISGTSFTVSGTNLASSSTPNTLTLSGGTLRLDPAVVPLANIAATAANNGYANISNTVAWVGMDRGFQSAPDKNALANNAYTQQWAPSAGNWWGKWHLDNTVANASFNIRDVFWWQYRDGYSGRGITTAKLYYSNSETDPGVPSDSNPNWTMFYDNTGGTAFPLATENNHHTVVDLSGLSLAARWIGILPTTPVPQDGNGLHTILFTQANTFLPNTAIAATASSTLDLETAGLSQTLGPLSIANSGTELMLVQVAGATLAFADSSTLSWEGTLNFSGTFVAGSSLRFGTSSSGLTPAQLARIKVNGSGAGTYTLDANGYLVVGGATYTVTYDGNTNTGGSVPTDSGTYATGATVTVLANTGSLVKTGYTFTGWNTLATGLGTHYAATGSDSFLMGSANTTLYAEWKTPYNAWAAGFLPANVSNPAGNNDGDTLTNLQEYAFGTDPTVSTGEIAYSGGTLTTPGTPKIVEAGGTYSIVFGRRADYVAAGLTYTVQFSAGLDTWVDNNDGTNPPVQVATDGTINAMSVPFVDFITTPSGTQKPTFARVKVTMP